MATANRENNYNLIRLVLASAVILAHSPEIIDGDRQREPAARLFGPWTSLGELAVAGFFILSGYLIALSWLRDPRIGDYLTKRILRIYPGFLLAGLVSGLILAPLGTAPGYWSLFSRRRFVLGLPLLRLAVPTAFVDLPYPIINGPIWTIQYEFACYLVLLTLGLVGVLRHRWLMMGLALGVTAWAGLQAYGLVPAVESNSLISGMDGEIPRLLACFLAGATAARFEDRISWWGPWVVGLAAIGLTLALRRATTGTIALPWLGAVLLLAAGRAPLVPGTAWVRRNDVSYGVYLYSWPIQMLLIARLGVRNPWLVFALALPLAFLAGWISWRLVEKRALRLKGWFGRPAPSIPRPA